MASDRYNYVLTESAEADIDEAFDYIACDLVNPDAAARMTRAFILSGSCNRAPQQ